MQLFPPDGSTTHFPITEGCAFLPPMVTRFLTRRPSIQVLWNFTGNSKRTWQTVTVAVKLRTGVPNQYPAPWERWVTGKKLQISLHLHMFHILWKAFHKSRCSGFHDIRKVKNTVFVSSQLLSKASAYSDMLEPWQEYFIYVACWLITVPVNTISRLADTE